MRISGAFLSVDVDTQCALDQGIFGVRIDAQIDISFFFVSLQSQPGFMVSSLKGIVLFKLFSPPRFK